MFVTLEKFFNEYRIKNGQAPNETVMNRGTMRLKREIRELKTYFDLMQGNQIEQWDENRNYEVDEYVEYKGFIYKSLIDGNYADIPDVAETWERVIIKQIDYDYNVLKSNIFTSEENQSVFKLDFNSSSVIVFLDGVLQDKDVYDSNSSTVVFKEPLEEGRTVTVLSSIGYESAILLPKKEFRAEQDQYEFEVDFDLTEPSVFVDGKLIPEKDYDYERRKVILEEPVDENTFVVVCNGNTVGTDLYTKREIDDLLTQYLLINNAYTRDEIDELKANTLRDIDNLYRLKSESYTIFEIDNKFFNYYTKSEVDELINSQYFDTLAGYGIKDAYTKDEVNTLFTSLSDFNQLVLDVSNKADKADTLLGYGILDAYTKTETDSLLEWKADKADTLAGYGITDTYTKPEIDDLIRNVTVTVDDLDLSEYAKKSTTLAGYGITDTYTKPEIDELLTNMQDSISLDNLNADYLDGFSSEQFVRSDIRCNQTGGVAFFSQFEKENQSVISITPTEIPNIEMSYKKVVENNKEFSVDERVFSTTNSDDLYFVAEGDFRGTWFENIRHFGILNVQEYNWFVNIFPIQEGDDLSFVPKTYNSGYIFRKHTNEKTEYESSYYHYGYVDGDQVKMYSYYKSGEDFIETYSHYQLIGVKKCISTHIHFNQGDLPLAPLTFNEIDSDKIAFLSVQNSQKKVNMANAIEPNVINDNALSENDIATTVAELPQLYVEPSVNTIVNAELFLVTIRGGVPNETVNFVLAGDGEIIKADTEFNEVGCAVLLCRGRSPFTDDIKITVSSEDRRSDYCVINMTHRHSDDPDTTLNWDNTGWDYTVFTSTDENLYEDDPDTTLNWDTTGFDNTVFGNKGN